MEYFPDLQRVIVELYITGTLNKGWRDLEKCFNFDQLNKRMLEWSNLASQCTVGESWCFYEVFCLIASLPPGPQPLAVSGLSSGLNAQARKLQRGRSRVTSLFVDGSEGEVDGPPIWRSLSDMDVSAMGQEAGRVRRALGVPRGPSAAVTPPESPGMLESPEATEAEVDAEARSLRTEKEETESSDDNSTQYSIHPPFDFPYFLLLQGYSYRQVRPPHHPHPHPICTCLLCGGYFLSYL